MALGRREHVSPSLQSQRPWGLAMFCIEGSDDTPQLFSVCKAASRGISSNVVRQGMIYRSVL